MCSECAAALDGCKGGQPGEPAPRVAAAGLPLELEFHRDGVLAARAIRFGGWSPATARRWRSASRVHQVTVHGRVVGLRSQKVGHMSQKMAFTVVDKTGMT